MTTDYIVTLIVMIVVCTLILRGYFATDEGEETWQRNKSKIRLVAVVIFLLIALVLCAFGSLFYALTEMVWWPFGIVSSILALHIASYVGRWDGTLFSGRYRIYGFWWGYNLRTLSVFFIYNGWPFCFQIQTWDPKFAIWK